MSQTSNSKNHMIEVITILGCIMTEILINDSRYQPTLQINFTKYSNQRDLENNCKVSKSEISIEPIIEKFRILFKLMYTVS